MFPLPTPSFFEKKGNFCKCGKESNSTSSAATVKSLAWQLLALHRFFLSLYQGKLNKKPSFHYCSGVPEKLSLFISVIQQNYYAVKAAKAARLVKVIFSVVQTLVSLLTYLT